MSVASCVLFLISIFLFEYAPLSVDNSPAPNNSNDKESFGGADGGLPLLSFDEQQIVGKYSNGLGKSVEFSANKRGNISSGANSNARAAFSEIANGTFSWSATGTQITLVMDSGENFTAVFDADNYSIKIENEKFRLEGAPEELPPEVLEEIQSSSSGDPTIGGEIELEKRDVISRLVIVSAPAFSNSDTLKKYINHKTTQGFDVVHLPSSGETDEIIRSKLKDRYEEWQADGCSACW